MSACLDHCFVLSRSILFLVFGGGESVDDERRNIPVDAGDAMFRHLVEVSLALGPVDLDTGHLEM